ncbi:MAG: hypothetical protein ACE367_03085 [Acidimicrobiales bacterium]
MPSPRYRSLFAPAGLVGALLLGGCGSDEPLELTLAALAEGGEVVVTYDIGDGPVSETVTTPWELPVEVSGQFSVSLRVENPEPTGLVRCVIDQGGPGSPAATGEAAATCELDGNAFGDSVSTASTARGEERTGPELLDEETGLTFELVTTALDGDPEAEPVLYEPLVFLVRLGPITEPGQLRVESELVDPENRRTNNEIFRYDLDDLDDGHLVYPVPQGGFVPTEPGTHRLVVEGTLFLESGAEYPFAERVELDFEPVEITRETVDHAAGAIALDVPSDWEQRFSATALTVSTEDGFPEARELSSSSFVETLEYRQLGGSGSVSVFQLDAPLSHAPDPELADELPAVAGLDPDQASVETAGIGDRSTVRVSGATVDVRIELDLVTAVDARFLVQTRAEVDDEESWEAATAMRDSLTFDESAIPRLLHRLPINSSQALPDGSVARFGLDIPADWLIADGPAGVIADQADDIGVRFVTRALDGRSLDAVIADEVDLEVDAASFDSSAPIEGFDESAIARADTDGDGRVDAIVVVATHADSATVLEFVDRTDVPDIELFDAMIDTLTVLE